MAQGGGPTAVINQSLMGVVLQARKFPEIERVYGARFGVSGIVKEDFIDLSIATDLNLEQVANTPGAALGSTRDKPDTAYCEKMFAVMQKHNIRYFFYIGGNDSAETCRIVNNEAKAAGYELRVVHIPKTIDNDILVTDHCPGFGSAARFVAHAFVGANLDNMALPGVYIGVVMGRHAGFLTGSSILAKKFPDDGPHLIYLPERSFGEDRFVADVERIYARYGRCVVAVSEGIVDEKNELVAVRLQKEKEHDAHGNICISGSGALGDLLVDLIKTKTNIKRVRSDTFGYLQRSFLGCVSAIDREEARAVGEKAVQFCIDQDVDGSVVIDRVSDYSVSYRLAPLESVAARSKSMPADFISGDNMVSEKFVNYVRPLVGEIEDFDRLSVPSVDKIN